MTAGTPTTLAGRVEQGSGMRPTKRPQNRAVCTEQAEQGEEWAQSGSDTATRAAGVLTTHPGLLPLETMGDHCHLDKSRECWGTHASPGHIPAGPEPEGPPQPALPTEVTRLRSIRLQCREVIREDKGALVLGVHLPGQET